MSVSTCISAFAVEGEHTLRESLPKERLPHGQQDGKWLPRREIFFPHKGADRRPANSDASTFEVLLSIRI